MTLHTTDKIVQEIARKAFPDYNGKKFCVQVETGTINTTYNAYWSGGSRTYYNFVRLDTLQSMGEVPAQHPVFNKPINGADKVQLVPGLMCVKRTYFCGKDLGITIVVHPDNAPRLLPDTSEYTRDEMIVLIATRSYKNTYGGKTNIRFKEAHRDTGITEERWETAKQICIEKNLLNKAGSITNTGRNIAQQKRLYEFK